MARRERIATSFDSRARIQRGPAGMRVGPHRGNAYAGGTARGNSLGRKGLQDGLDPKRAEPRQPGNGRAINPGMGRTARRPARL